MFSEVGLLTFQLINTGFLCGLIWLVQMVHYPAFHFIDSKQFAEFHKFHSRSISFVVMPTMVSELVTATLSAYLNPSPLWLTNLLLVVSIWLVTFSISVPLHNLLQSGKETSIIAKLIQTNWLRTALWTGKLAVLIKIAIP